MPANYYLAKHIPDLHRHEPRNVGVIVWMPGGEVAARFLAEKPGEPGVVDGRSIPPFVVSEGAYRQWVKFWRGYVAADRPEHPLTGAAIHRSDAEFMAALSQASRGQFVLEEGGEVIDARDEESIEALVDSLYAGLVEESATDEPRDPTLNDVCERLIEQTGLNSDNNFKRQLSVVCSVGEAGRVDEYYQFSYAYKNGSLKRLYQQVAIPKRRKAIEKNSRASAWMFEQVVRAHKIPSKDDVTALIYASEAQLAEPDVARALGVLAAVGRVLNVANETAAREEFAALPALATH
jgi:hypothetical protein